MSDMIRYIVIDNIYLIIMYIQVVILLILYWHSSSKSEKLKKELDIMEDVRDSVMSLSNKMSNMVDDRGIGVLYGQETVRFMSVADFNRGYGEVDIKKLRQDELYLKMTAGKMYPMKNYGRGV